MPLNSVPDMGKTPAGERGSRNHHGGRRAELTGREKTGMSAES